MERLEKASPSIALTEGQKKKIAEVDSVCRAKIAEKELFLKDQIRKAQSAGNLEEAESLEKQLASEIRRFCRKTARRRKKSCAPVPRNLGSTRVSPVGLGVAPKRPFLAISIQEKFAIAGRHRQHARRVRYPDADGSAPSMCASRSPRFGRSGSRKPSICARLIVRTPSCFCRSVMLWRNASIFVQCTLGRK